MTLKNLSLKNFRIHKKSDITFSNNLNFIVGGNGQGKTSILEAIYIMCTTKNFKASSDSELTRFGGNEFEIDGKFEDLTEDIIRIYFNKSDNKRYYFQNGKQLNRNAEIIGKFPIVLLTPEDHSLTQGYPAERRKFVDSVICQASELYLSSLLDYNKTLRQRSNLLFRLNENYSSSLIDQLEAWDEKLINTGTELIRFRMKFVLEFEKYVEESFRFIVDDSEKPVIKYDYLNSYSGDSIEEMFKKLLIEKKDEEIRRRSNLVGPHRDDFIFLINENELKIFGSQGQHKTFQVALRFAQYFYLKDKIGRLPIFLLDDVFGELDSKRAIRISQYLKQVGQAFITITDFANFSFLHKEEDDAKLLISNGEVSYA